MAENGGRAVARQSNERDGGPAVLARRSEPLDRTPEAAAMVLERVVTMGDLRDLEPEERVHYYLDLCQSLGLNPRSRPFDWIEFYDPDAGKKLQLYPNKSCTDQLRAVHRIRIKTDMPTASPDGTMIRCVAHAWMPDGREDVASKYVPTTDRQGNRLRGTQLANAYMKAETGAKRRVTFSLIGLAAPPKDLDEVEYRAVTVDGRGHILDQPTEEQKALAGDPGLASAIGETTFEDLADADHDSPFEGMPDQRPEADPGMPRREGPAPSFRCDKKHWSIEWGKAVRDTPLAKPQARHDFIRRYTDGWTGPMQTDSLATFLDHATDGQARDLVEAGKDEGRRLRAEHAAVLTGAPPLKPEPFDLPNDPDWGAWEEQPDREAVMTALIEWLRAAQRLDPSYEIADPSGLEVRELISALSALVTSVERVHAETFGEAEVQQAAF